MSKQDRPEGEWRDDLGPARNPTLPRPPRTSNRLHDSGGSELLSDTASTEGDRPLGSCGHIREDPLSHSYS